MSDLDKLCEILGRVGMGNIHDLTYSFHGMSQTPRGKYGAYPKAPTEGQYKHVRKLIKEGRACGRIEMHGSGRWAQYTVAGK